MKKFFLVLGFIMGTLVVCRKPETLQVENPVIRKPPAGTSITAAFFTIKNSTGKEVALIDAFCEVAKTEVHETYLENNMARMRRIARLPVPPGGELVLQPGGYHVMLIDLKRELSENETIPLVLKFENYSDITVQATVKNIGGTAHH